MKQFYLYSDAGQLFARSRYFDNEIEELKNEIKICEPTSMNFKFGRLDALLEGKCKLHKVLVDEIIEIKKQIEDNNEIDEIFSEIEYLNGYLKGIEDILNYDRQLFENNSSFILFVYSMSEETISKYQLALYASDLFSDVDEPNKVKYYISTNVDKICERITDLEDNTEFAICVIYTKDYLPNKEIMQKLSFGRNGNVYLLRDNDAMKLSVQDIIKRMVKSTII